MTLLEIILNYEQELENNSDKLYSTLLFSLQLPSVCSRKEFPKTVENTRPNNTNDSDEYLYWDNGRPLDEKLYNKWLQSHRNTFIYYFNEKAIVDLILDGLYELRNNLTHGGYLYDDNKLPKIVFIEKDATSIWMNKTIYLDPYKLIKCLFTAAKNSFVKNSNQPIVDIINVTPFSSLVIPKEEMTLIRTEIDNLIDTFWMTRKGKWPKLERQLYQIYILISDKYFPTKEEQNNYRNKFKNNEYIEFDTTILSFGYDELIKTNDNVYVKENKNVLSVKIDLSTFDKIIQFRTSLLSKDDEINRRVYDKYIIKKLKGIK